MSSKKKPVRKSESVKPKKSTGKAAGPRPALRIDDTARGQVEETLLEAKSLLHTVLDNAPITIFAMDKQGVFTLSAGKGLERVGLKPGENVGASALDLYGSLSFFEETGKVITGKNVIRRALAGETMIVFNELRGVNFENRIGPIRDAGGAIAGVVGIATDISDRKQAEEALRISEEKFRTIAEQVADMIYLTDDLGVVTFVSPAVTSIFGYLPGEMEGHNFTDFLSGTDIPKAIAAYQLSLSEGSTTRNLELTMKRKDGSLFTGELIGSLYRREDRITGAIGLIRDITERKQAEEALRESEARYHTVLQQSLEAIYLYDLDTQRVLEANLTFLNLLGYTAEEARSLTLYDIVANDRASIDAYLHHIQSKGGTPLGERLWRRKDGTTVQVEVTANRIESGRRNIAFFVARDITERKRAEEALRESEEKFRGLFENSHDALMVIEPPSWKFTSGNPACVKMFGAKNEEEFISYSPWELSSDRQPDGRDSAEKAREMIETAVREGFHFFEWTHRRIGGEEFPADVLLIRLERGDKVVLQATVRDITERKQAQTLQEAVYKIAAATETTRSPDELYHQIHQIISSVMPAENFYITLYDEAQNILRFPYFKDAADEPFIGEIQPGKGLTAYVLRTSKSLLCTQAVHDELERQGEIKLLGAPSAIWLGVPLVVEDKTIGAMVVQHYSDPTAYGEREQHMLEFVSTQVAIAINRKRTEEKILQLNAELEKRVEERTRELRDTQDQLVRQEKLAVLGQLAGGVGHELRNPLTVINNAVYYLKLVQPDAGEKVKQYLAMIEQETHNAGKIVNDLLDFARIKSVEREPVSVTELVQRVLIRFPAPESITTLLNLPASLPKVFADPRQMEQVLGNLTVNACQAMPTGGRLTISARRLEEMVAIAVNDTGAGISPEDMAKLFEPLFTTKSKGIGLGLSVSKKLAEANGGRIEVQSEQGKGSTFTLYIPVNT